VLGVFFLRCDLVKVSPFRMDQASEDGWLLLYSGQLPGVSFGTQTQTSCTRPSTIQLYLTTRKWKEGGCPHSASVGDTSSLPRAPLGLCYTADYCDHSRLERADDTSCSPALRELDIQVMPYQKIAPTHLLHIGEIYNIRVPPSRDGEQVYLI
jgi:hypothetical protein